MDELTKQKYKRCIYIARWCWERRWRVEFNYEFWTRWGMRWFEIAENFKGGKT